MGEELLDSKARELRETRLFHLHSQMVKIYRGGKETVFPELKNICLGNPARGRDLFPEFAC